MAQDQRKYYAYLLRLWSVEETCDPNGTKTVWRVTLENTQTHTRHGFANMERAFAFLQKQVHRSKEDCDETD